MMMQGHVWLDPIPSPSQQNVQKCICLTWTNILTGFPPLTFASLPNFTSSWLGPENDKNDLPHWPSVTSPWRSHKQIEIMQWERCIVVDRSIKPKWQVLPRMHLLLYVWPWCVQPALWKMMNGICTKKKQRCPSHMAWGEKYFSRPFDLDHAFSGEGVSVDFREFFLGFLPSASLCPAVYYLCARKTLSKRLLSSSSLDRVTRSIWRSGVVITVILAHLLHRKMQQMQSIKFPLNYLAINQNVTHRDKCVYLSHFKPWRRTLDLWLMK